MIIPSIDIQNGQTVQLVGGKELALEAGDPLPLARKFGRVGEVAVIDLDAAMSNGTNEELIRSLLQSASCRVGGGIRDLQTATKWLDAGAEKIILGTAARPELLKELPSERVIAALDAFHSGRGDGEVLDQGWQRKTGASVLDRMRELKGMVGGFLITFVEREGQMTGIDLETIKSYQDAAGEARLTIAGGIASANEIAELDRLGIDAQIGMALYTNEISLADGFCSPLKSDRDDSLWPTIVASRSGQSLGLVYSNHQSVEASIETGEAHFYSRKRGLWKKGETSGNTQMILSIGVDCDRDTLLFTVDPKGNDFCHLQQPTCFGQFSGLSKLQSVMTERLESAPHGSYTARLFESKEFLDAKIFEEANELLAAYRRQDLIHETADLFYFVMAKLIKNDITLGDIEDELDRRSRKITRRAGDTKVELN